MQTRTQSDELNAIVNKLLGHEPKNRLATIFDDVTPPFDISRPNIHDSKKEFKKELKAVQTVVDSVYNILRELSPKNDSDPLQKDMTDRLSIAINQTAYRSRRLSIETARELIMRNAVDTGFYFSSLFVLIEMSQCYDMRLRELKDQEKQFWSVPHRPPNYYARTIALRLARLYAKELRKAPTFGTARDGKHPSTDFGRALEQVFTVLGIKASATKAAEWAVGQLTEEDIHPPAQSLLGGLLGLAEKLPHQSTGQNALTKVGRELLKKPKGS